MQFFLNGTGRKRPDSETVGHWGVNLSSLMRTWLTWKRNSPITALLIVLMSLLLLGVLGWQLLVVPIATLLQVMSGAMLGFAATSAGAALIVFPGQRHPRFLALALSFSGGMMLAAAVFSLLLPAAHEMSLLWSGTGGAFAIAAAIAAGAILMCLLERHVPHGHPVAGDTGPGHQHLNRLWLFVLAIALHNLPEGLAVGVSFAGSGQTGASVSLAIALQDLPEGYAMAIVLLKLGVSRQSAIGWSLLAGLLEPTGALAGIALGSIAVLTYPILLALAAGAMLFVVVHEVIPETQYETGHSAPTEASLWLLAGFLFLWLVEQQM